MQEKEDKSKMSKLEYKELKMQDYLISNDISIKKQKLIFKWRTRMIQVGDNFGQIKACPVCKYFVTLDSQDHLFNCAKLNDLHDMEDLKINSDDLYSNDLKKVKSAVCKLEKLIRKRETTLGKLM